MRIYLNNCCYNRHHDKKVSEEIIQDKNIRDRNYNDFFIKNYRTIYIGVDRVDDLSKKVELITKNGIKTKDAYHIASAILAECDFFVTVDKKLLKYSSEEVKIISPVDFVKIWSDNHDER